MPPEEYQQWWKHFRIWSIIPPERVRTKRDELTVSDQMIKDKVFLKQTKHWVIIVDDKEDILWPLVTSCLAVVKAFLDLINYSCRKERSYQERRVDGVRSNNKRQGFPQTNQALGYHRWWRRRYLLTVGDFLFGSGENIFGFDQLFHCARLRRSQSQPL